MNFQKAYSSPGSGLETDSFTPSLIKLSLSTYYVSGTCLSAGYPKLNKIPKGSPEAEWGNQMRTDLGQGVAVRQQLKSSARCVQKLSKEAQQGKHPHHLGG